MGSGMGARFGKTRSDGERDLASARTIENSCVYRSCILRHGISILEPTGTQHYTGDPTYWYASMCGRSGTDGANRIGSAGTGYSIRLDRSRDTFRFHCTPHMFEDVRPVQVITAARSYGIDVGIG